MNSYEEFISSLHKLIGKENIRYNEQMKFHTSFKVGGPADIFITPENYQEVCSIIRLCNNVSMPYYIVGNGSNLLVRDKGIRGAVVKLTKLDKIHVEGERITAQGGASLKEVSNRALMEGLTGLEFACGIPGSIGGAATMNAGAYDGEVSRVIERALVCDTSGKVIELSGAELEFGYRMSAILKYNYTVLEVTFKLCHGDRDKIRGRMEELTHRREDKQPLEYPSAGSTFKRPEGYFTGQLIEESGLKGYNLGGAQVSQKHAGFIINTGNATAKDILDLIEYVTKVIRERYGVELHTEVRIIGED